METGGVGGGGSTSNSSETKTAKVIATPSTDAKSHHQTDASTPTGVAKERLKNKTRVNTLMAAQGVSGTSTRP